MIILRRRDGQTLIETALILFLLLVILLGITEFARAWFTKNSAKNASRTAVRVAVVTPGITTQLDVPNTADPTGPSDCAPLTGNARIFCYVWTSPGIKQGASASLTIEDVNGNGLDESDVVTVTTTMPFSTVVPRMMGQFIPTQLSGSASMRYE